MRGELEFTPKMRSTMAQRKKNLEIFQCVSVLGMHALTEGGPDAWDLASHKRLPLTCTVFLFALLETLLWETRTVNLLTALRKFEKSGSLKLELKVPSLCFTKYNFLVLTVKLEVMYYCYKFMTVGLSVDSTENYLAKF
ncbi:MAG: hypothetical protein CM15mP62_33650 [Rhodospirillaceae bacterium]|nr:MAG: hypothetical protein CM15mP62_33650 [Rhodospirillaceae bacterium]